MIPYGSILQMLRQQQYDIAQETLMRQEQERQRKQAYLDLALMAGGGLAGGGQGMGTGAVTGAIGGGVSGASIGTMIAPGIGTAIGGGAGALLGGVGGGVMGGASGASKGAAQGLGWSQPLGQALFGPGRTMPAMPPGGAPLGAQGMDSMMQGFGQAQGLAGQMQALQPQQQPPPPDPLGEMSWSVKDPDTGATFSGKGRAGYEAFEPWYYPPVPEEDPNQFRQTFNQISPQGQRSVYEGLKAQGPHQGVQGESGPGFLALRELGRGSAAAWDAYVTPPVRFAGRVLGLGGGERGGSPSSSPSVPLSSRDQEALEWARANPDDPRAKEILERLGML